MKKNKVIGVVLLVLAAAVIVGLFVDKTKLWYALDYITIVVCAISGLLLLKEK
ncbi:hypothetical protein ACFL42_00070 [Candidatus Omnitrophota bacterium]